MMVCASKTCTHKTIVEQWLVSEQLKAKPDIVLFVSFDLLNAMVTTLIISRFFIFYMKSINFIILFKNNDRELYFNGK